MNINNYSTPNNERKLEVVQNKSNLQHLLSPVNKSELVSYFTPEEPDREQVDYQQNQMKEEDLDFELSVNYIPDSEANMNNNDMTNFSKKRTISINSRKMNQSLVSKKEISRDYNNDQLYEDSLVIEDSATTANNNFANSNFNNLTRNNKEITQGITKSKTEALEHREIHRNNELDDLQDNHIYDNEIDTEQHYQHSEGSADLFSIRDVNTQTQSFKHSLYHNSIDTSNLSIRDFSSIKIIGKGAFGEVRVCRFKLTGEVVAVKMICRAEMAKKNQTKHILVERDILSNADSNWVVPLKLAFQDDEYLYLVMEFMPGGDLMSLLMQEEVFDEEAAKLYAAELVCAIESVHNLKAIHRDIKPDNVLIDKNGHIKLSDFGLSRVIVCKLKYIINKFILGIRFILGEDRKNNVHEY